MPPNHPFLNEPQSVQSGCAGSPRHSFASECSFWIIRKCVLSCCQSLFSDLSNNSNNSVWSVLGASWFTHISHSTHKAVIWTPICEEDSALQVVDNIAQSREHSFLSVKVGLRITAQSSSGILSLCWCILTAAWEGAIAFWKGDQLHQNYNRWAQYHRIIGNSLLIRVLEEIFNWVRFREYESVNVSCKMVNRVKLLAAKSTDQCWIFRPRWWKERTSPANFISIYSQTINK